MQKELTTNDVVARMKQAETQLIVTDSVFLTMAAVASAALGGIRLFLPETERGLFGPEVPEYHEFKIDTEEEAQNSVAFVNRTSGSTGGKLKTVITTHAHFIAALEATLHTVPKNTDPDTDTWLSSLSFGFFINSKLHIGLNILLGIPVVIMDTVFGPDTLDIVERHGITFLFVPPPVAASFAKLDGSRKSVDVGSIKWLLSAGASMHEGLQQATSRKLNGVHLDLEWGTSETLLIAIQMDGHDSPAGSSGVLVNGIEAKVIDTVTHEELEAGESGEIYIRNTACRYAGYKANDTANRETFDGEGWFHSGDYGYIDDDRNVFITDRLKELIRVGGGYGVHISGTELESVIFSHPAVSQVVVTGVSDATAGVERPTAFVILAPEWQEKQDVALTSLRQWVRERLTGLQTLNGGFFCLTEFPLIGFKINRRALKSFAVNSRLKEKADARTMNGASVVMPGLVRVA